MFRAGAEADWNPGQASILAPLQRNRDRTPSRERNFDEIITMLAEARYVLLQELMPSVRFENLNPNFGLALHRTTLRSTILARANVRFIPQGVLRCNSARNRVRDSAVMTPSTLRAFRFAWTSPSGCHGENLVHR